MSALYLLWVAEAAPPSNFHSQSSPYALLLRGIVLRSSILHITQDTIQLSGSLDVAQRGLPESIFHRLGHQVVSSETIHSSLGQHLGRSFGNSGWIRAQTHGLIGRDKAAAFDPDLLSRRRCHIFDQLLDGSGILERDYDISASGHSSLVLWIDGWEREEIIIRSSLCVGITSTDKCGSKITQAIEIRAWRSVKGQV